MQNRKDREHSTIRTQRRGLFAWLGSLWGITVNPLSLQIQLKGETDILYPRMSRGEIRHVAAAICRIAMRDAK